MHYLIPYEVSQGYIRKEPNFITSLRFYQGNKLL